MNTNNSDVQLSGSILSYTCWVQFCTCKANRSSSRAMDSDAKLRTPIVSFAISVHRATKRVMLLRGGGNKKADAGASTLVLIRLRSRGCSPCTCAYTAAISACCARPPDSPFLQRREGQRKNKGGQINSQS